MLTNLASQREPRKYIHALELNEICNFMEENFFPKQFISREILKFWRKMNRKPGKSIQKLFSRIPQDAVTCEFPSITNNNDSNNDNSLYETLQTRFICSINNEAVLKALFKIKDSV